MTGSAARELNRALLAPALDPNISEEEKRNALTGAMQAAQYFRQNVLQGVANGPDTFGARCLPHILYKRLTFIHSRRPIPVETYPSFLVPTLSC